MPTFSTNPQSYKWDRWVVEAPSETWVGKGRIEVRRDGNTTYVDVIPDESAPVATIRPIRWEGTVQESKNSKGSVILAVSSSGSWSGGGNYSGWILGRLGARVALGRKGTWKYYHFIDESTGWEETGPIKDTLPATQI